MERVPAERGRQHNGEQAGGHDNAGKRNDPPQLPVPFSRRASCWLTFARVLSLCPSISSLEFTPSRYALRWYRSFSTEVTASTAERARTRRLPTSPPLPSTIPPRR